MSICCGYTACGPGQSVNVSITRGIAHGHGGVQGNSIANQSSECCSDVSSNPLVEQDVVYEGETLVPRVFSRTEDHEVLVSWAVSQV